MTASDAQLAELIEMEQKPAKRERRIPCVLKLHMQYRGRYPSDPEFVLPNWYRDFEVADKTTLEQLAGVILQILGWVEDHLYEFKINGRRNVNFGNDGDYPAECRRRQGTRRWTCPISSATTTRCSNSCATA